ncbi:hypothetical protein ABIE85_003896 [Bradyrhizobium diazoefficiens]
MKVRLSWRRPTPATQSIGWNKWGLKTDFKRRLIARSMSGKPNGVVPQASRLIQNRSQGIGRDVYFSRHLRLWVDRSLSAVR